MHITGQPGNQNSFTGQKKIAQTMDQLPPNNKSPVDGSVGKVYAGAWVVTLLFLGLVLFVTNP